VNIEFPLHFDNRRGIALDNDEKHVRDMIEQLLFTNPGERVNRPDFGCGLLHRVFEPTGPELATVEFTIAAAFQQWLGDVLEVTQLTITSVESTLHVGVEYELLASRRRSVIDIMVPGGGAL